MNGVALKRATEAQDLGVTLDSALQWDIHVKNIISKANHVRGLICPPLSDMLPSIQNLFYTVVL